MRCGGIACPSPMQRPAPPQSAFRCLLGTGKPQRYAWRVRHRARWHECRCRCSLAAHSRDKQSGGGPTHRWAWVHRSPAGTDKQRSPSGNLADGLGLLGCLLSAWSETAAPSLIEPVILDMYPYCPAQSFPPKRSLEQAAWFALLGGQASPAFQAVSHQAGDDEPWLWGKLRLVSPLPERVLCFVKTTRRPAEDGLSSLLLPWAAIIHT